MSIIGNIYTKTLKEDIFSGNIIIEIADHLLQFISVKQKWREEYWTQLLQERLKMFNEQRFLQDILTKGDRTRERFLVKRLSSFLAISCNFL